MLNIRDKSKNGGEPAEMPVPPRPNKAPLPRAANLPPAKIYDDDVLAQLQRWKDLQTENEALTLEVEEWRRRALSAEGEVRRLEMRVEQDRRQAEQDLAKQADMYSHKLKTVGDELDFQKGECVRVNTLAQAGATVFLQILDFRHKPAPSADAAGTVGLAAIAAELDKPDPELRDVDEPLPRVVAAGPREHGEDLNK